ncbi:MAG: cytochrome c oxidase subunit II [Silicimonas sp.]|nr:cytochrome c oxidase subunit II [Silicimonas sp.]NND40507.1 cytochrome c oxidase subunit II [Silicimonas sp.]NNL34619.1 cytochrome c oxidase subunit II [Silicimonas sp.]NNL73294.1 cytochrome c oxidase subunit II [Silicimonas sp.]RZW04036.1 MAG: cytochrome c oxidase subunit II [Paracoccaceae bacterium]
MRLQTIKTGIAAGLATVFATAAAHAQDLPIIGEPKQGLLGFQPAATELMEDIHWLDGMLLIIITAISVFVVALLAICILRYNQRSNPEPAQFTHNTPVEVAWTVIPIVILVFIGAFSLPVLFKQQEIPEPEVFVKATGYQWYWGYEYPDQDIAFESFMIGSGENRMTPAVLEELQAQGYTEDQFLLATDTSVVVPTGKIVVVQVTGADVIHAWTIPAFGVKQDAVPGRLAEMWFEVEEGMEGIYFGQCSELCGLSHAYMPITVKAVTQAEYDAWVSETQTAGRYVEPGSVRVAAGE